MLNKVMCGIAMSGEKAHCILTVGGSRGSGGDESYYVGFSTNYLPYIGSLSRTPYWVTAEGEDAPLVALFTKIKDSGSSMSVIGTRVTAKSYQSITVKSDLFGEVEFDDMIYGKQEKYGVGMFSEADIGKKVPLVFAPPRWIFISAVNGTSFEEVA